VHTLARYCVFPSFIIEIIASYPSQSDISARDGASVATGARAGAS